MHCMKVVCLNVRSGGGKRWRGILDFIEAQRSDVVVFTEWRRSEAPGVAAIWAESGGMRWIGACDGATKNGIFVASTLPFDVTSVTPDKNTAGTLLRVAFHGWTMLAAYFPQREVKANYFKVCTDQMGAVGAAPILLLGDLNTGNQHVDRTAAGEKYACAEQFDELSESHGFGFIDLWRRTQGAETREWSWITKANGFRLDHAFGNAAFVAAFDPTCRYDHSTRESGSTDHSALLISASARF